jgi:hypothetical protein
MFEEKKTLVNHFTLINSVDLFHLPTQMFYLLVFDKTVGYRMQALVPHFIRYEGSFCTTMYMIMCSLGSPTRITQQ